MEPKSLFQFSVNSIIMFIIWAMCQLPRSWNIQVDVDKIMQAITMEVNGQRVSADPWPEAPTMAQYQQQSSSTSSPSSTSSSFSTNTPSPSDLPKSGSVSRVEVHQQWIQHVKNMSKYNPHEYLHMRDCDGDSSGSDLENNEEDSGLRKHYVILNILYLTNIIAVQHGGGMSMEVDQDDVSESDEHNTSRNKRTRSSDGILAAVKRKYKAN